MNASILNLASSSKLFIYLFIFLFCKFDLGVAKNTRRFTAEYPPDLRWVLGLITESIAMMQSCFNAYVGSTSIIQLKAYVMTSSQSVTLEQSKFVAYCVNPFHSWITSHNFQLTLVRYYSKVLSSYRKVIQFKVSVDVADTKILDDSNVVKSKLNEIGHGF